jgi:hypothetical protein
MSRLSRPASQRRKSRSKREQVIRRSLGLDAFALMPGVQEHKQVTYMSRSYNHISPQDQIF